MKIEDRIQQLATTLKDKKNYGATDGVTLFRLYCGLSLVDGAKITIETADRCRYKSIY